MSESTISQLILEIVWLENPLMSSSWEKGAINKLTQCIYDE